MCVPGEIVWGFGEEHSGGGRFGFAHYVAGYLGGGRLCHREEVWPFG